MRKFTFYFGLLLLSVLGSCGGSNQNTQSVDVSTTQISEGQNASEADISEAKVPPANISEADLSATVSYLASDELEGRKTGTEGIEKAAQYIETIFEEHQIEPYFSSYRDHFEVDGIKAYNLVGLIEGNDAELKNEFIILGAHYDHVGTEKAVDGDSIANGANDNAVGTAGVIEAAKYFAKHKNNKRSILFVLFSAEELGLKGAYHLAERLKSQELNLYTMLNFEMIGIPMENKSYQAYLTGFQKSNFAEKFNDYVGEEVFGLLPQASQYQLFRRSDNYPFFKEFNVPAQTFSTFDFTNYDYYHHVKDEANLIDYTHMAKLLENVIPGISKMANTELKEIKMN